MNKRHTDFYIPVLKVLEDMEEHEINVLIEEVASFCQLTEEDRQEMTRGGSNPRYISNIQWATTDLCQGGFISRESRGVYKILYEGLLMLEDNPVRPTREYLYSKSEKFRDFVNRKGTRSREEKDVENLFSQDDEMHLVKEPTINNVKSDSNVSELNTILEELSTLIKLRASMKAANIGTQEIDAKIADLQAKILTARVVPILQTTLDELCDEETRKYAVLIDMFSSEFPVAYIVSQEENLKKFFNNVEPLLGSCDKKITVKRKQIENSETQEEPSDRLTLISSRKPSARLMVKLDNGTILNYKFSADTFAECIHLMNPEKVMQLGYQTSGMPLVGMTRPEKYNYKKLPSGHYVATNISTTRKKYLLDRIAQDLNIGIEVEILD